MEYFVSSSACSGGNGTPERPFRTISAAAETAMPGDIITVMPGTYREEVVPPRGGTEEKRITYRSAVPGEAEITGAEIMKGWEKVSGTIYRLSVDNAVFGGYNPYTEVIFGDWYNSPLPYHAGEVYLNGRSMFEVFSLKELEDGTRRDRAWDSSFAMHRWYTEQDGASTVIYADFQGADPEKECVEINVRRRCFFPAVTGIGYITLSGFTICKAATTWAPPTAFQDGMIGTHWSRGWIIENCDISDSKCSGISLGKYYRADNENVWARFGIKDGTQTQREEVCQAIADGWTKESVGSHIIRRCHIHDCEQTGIVGHMGGAFSVIEDNEIDHINNKGQLEGAEIGGIKLHAALDTIIRRNRIHHCTRGIWLDWEAQGTRVSSNVLYANATPENVLTPDRGLQGEDLFIEVSHGPTTVDNNLFLSPFPLRLAAQGTAFIHNVFCGPFTSVGSGTNNGKTKYQRYTPYHMPHNTALYGFMTIMHGDNRFFGNIFTGTEKYKKEITENGLAAGTYPFNDYPDEKSYYGRLEKALREDIRIDRERFYDPLPVWAEHNVYLAGAKPMEREKDAEVIDGHFTYEEKDGKIFIDTDILRKAKGWKGRCWSTEDLGKAFEPEEAFESPDGSPIVFDEDINGVKRCCGNILPGPFSTPESLARPL